MNVKLKFGETWLKFLPHNPDHICAILNYLFEWKVKDESSKKRMPYLCLSNHLWCKISMLRRWTADDMIAASLESVMLTVVTWGKLKTSEVIMSMKPDFQQHLSVQEKF